MNHSVSHLKFFGFVAYAHVPDELKNKLDMKGQKCIFVGYSEDTKEYKFYDPIARKVTLVLTFNLLIMNHGMEPSRRM